MTEHLKELRDRFPFLTYIQYNKIEIVGIVQNVTTQFMMVYEYDKIRGEDLRKQFLEAGEKWWYESNASIPIDIFIGRKFDMFRHALHGYAKKSIEFTDGPQVNLEEAFSKRIKKKRVELVCPLD